MNDNEREQQGVNSRNGEGRRELLKNLGIFSLGVIGVSSLKSCVNTAQAQQTPPPPPLDPNNPLTKLFSPEAAKGLTPTLQSLAVKDLQALAGAAVRSPSAAIERLTADDLRALSRVTVASVANLGSEFRVEIIRGRSKQRPTGPSSIGIKCSDSFCCCCCCCCCAVAQAA
jgi:hypothetical protein